MWEMGEAVNLQADACQEPRTVQAARVRAGASLPPLGRGPLGLRVVSPNLTTLGVSLGRVQSNSDHAPL